MGELNNGARPDRLQFSPLKRKLLEQKFVVGTFLGIPSPAIVELLGLGGFDFVVIDGEHSAIDLKETEDLIRAGHSTQISVLVRVAKCDSHLITQPLDMGAAGVQVPQIESPEMARMVVNAARYHPLGPVGSNPMSGLPVIALTERGSTLLTPTKSPSWLPRLRGRKE